MIQGSTEIPYQISPNKARIIFNKKIIKIIYVMNVICYAIRYDIIPIIIKPFSRVRVQWPFCIIDEAHKGEQAFPEIPILTKCTEKKAKSQPMCWKVEGVDDTIIVMFSAGNGQFGYIIS